MKNCNSKIQKILALLLSVMFIFVSCSDIFSGREETGSVTFSLSPELIQAVSNACRAADDDIAPSDEPTVTEQEGEKKEGKYKFEIIIGGKDYNKSDSKSADDLEKLKGEVFHFYKIPVGTKIQAEAKIIVGEDHLQWTVMKGKSEEKIIEAGENTLSFNLHQLAMCNVYNNTESGEALSDIERISVYALPSDSKEATEILELVAADTELNDLKIKSKLESYKDMLVGDYHNDAGSELSQYFADGYELKDGGEYYFLSLVYIKKGPVYLGQPAATEEAVTKISFNGINYITLSLTEVFSNTEKTGSVSVTLDLSSDLIRSVSKACPATNDGADSSEENAATEQTQAKYKVEIEINGDYRASDFRRADDLEKLDGRVFCFDNIPVGSKIFAEAKIIFGEGHLQWTVIKGESKELTVESGENTLLLNLYQLAMCNIYNNTESVEPLSDIERISVYALPCDSSEATDILKLVAIDSELNDFRIKSKLESYKDMLVGDYYKDGDSELSQYFTGSYELKDGGEYYFLSLVYIKKGPVYLGHPAFEGTDPELAEKAVTKISFDEINYIYLSLMEMHLESEEVEIRFRFWDEEKKDYVALESFPDKVLTNNDEYDEEFDELAKKAVERGYTINEDKSEELKYDEENDKYFIYVYFDKDIIEELFSLRGTAKDTEKYPGSFKFAIYSNLTYDITYNSDSIKDKIVSKGSVSIPEDDSKLPSSIIKFSITEKEYFAFKDMSSDVLEIVKEPKEKTVDLTNGSFEFTGASGVVISFSVGGQGIVPFSISLKPTSGAKVPEISKVHSVTLYAVDATNAKKLQTALASSEPSKAATDIINILEKQNEDMPEEVTYLQSYSSEVLKAKTSPIVIEGSFTTWGAMGKGKSLAIVAVVNYGDGKDIDAFCIGCSSVIEASAESNVVAFDYNPISVPCTISFCLGDDFAEEYTISTALSSFTPTKDETFLETVMAVAADTVEALKEKEYIYNRYVSGLSSGIPYVTLYFVESKVTAISLKVIDAPETIYVGESKSFGAKYVYSDGSQKAAESFRLETATGKTSDLVEVSDVKDGKITITGKTPGKVTFTVLSDEYEEIAATFTVTVEATSTSSGIKVTLAKTSTTDEGENVTLEFEETSDGLDFTATPKTGTTVTNYMWIVEGLTPESGNEGGANYHIPTSKYEELGFGVYHVTCIVTIDGEEYSVQTTFTLTSE